jgi:nitrogenase iron protein NifH
MEGNKRNNRRFIAFYGKGGIGKTIVSTNLAATLAKRGHQPILFGCSPKANVAEVYAAYGIEPPIPFLELYRTEGVSKDNIKRSYIKTPSSVAIFECGGPEPGIGCAGKGIGLALDEFTKYGDTLEEMSKADFMIYDVIGDVVCGGFATPMRQSDHVEVYVVSSGELMSLYACNNIIKAVNALQELGVRLGGLVANYRGVPKEDEIVEEFARRTKVPILAKIPRDPESFRKADHKGLTIVETFPDSNITVIFNELGKKIEKGVEKFEPVPIEHYDDLFEMYLSFQKSLMTKEEMETELAKAYKTMIPSNPVERGDPMRISIYGTGGIGKSTTSSNVSAALILEGEVVYQIGCDPKRDSIATLCGELKPTILESYSEYQAKRKRVGKEFMDQHTYQGVDYAGRLYGSECGGPSPGRGCAGRGVGLALDLMEKFKHYKEFNPTFILYDVLGDTVCGGFATPLEFAPQTYVVTSGELAPMEQAMKIIQSVMGALKQNPNLNTGIAGVIDNMRGVPHEKEIVEEVFGIIGVPVIHHIPRDRLVQEAENLKRTVVQVFPESDQSKKYRELGRNILENKTQLKKLKNPILHSKEIKKIIGKYN